jgi:hypothetical protein
LITHATAHPTPPLNAFRAVPFRKTPKLKGAYRVLHFKVALAVFGQTVWHLDDVLPRRPFRSALEGQPGSRR